jgi:hypothetical protein
LLIVGQLRRKIADLKQSVQESHARLEAATLEVG